MIVVFGYAMSELLMRRNESAAEIEHLFKRYLPEDDQTMLQVADLGSIVRQVKQGGEYERRFLPRLIHRVALQFQSSRSVDQANSLLNSSLELFLHEIDLHYNILRYIMWLIPTLGFIGTVRGIAQALARAGATKPDNPDLLSIVTSELAVAFDTTLIALLLSGVLVMLVHIIQASEERNLNRAGNYCVDNLINRLYEN
jgi:biopolymer transport protein ExbB/TolQ